MGKISINLPDELHDALRTVAERHGRLPATEAAAAVARELRRAEAAEAVRLMSESAVTDEIAGLAELREEQLARIAALDGRSA